MRQRDQPRVGVEEMAHLGVMALKQRGLLGKPGGEIGRPHLVWEQLRGTGNETGDGCGLIRQFGCIPGQGKGCSCCHGIEGKQSVSLGRKPS